MTLDGSPFDMKMTDCLRRRKTSILWNSTTIMIGKIHLKIQFLWYSAISLVRQNILISNIQEKFTFNKWLLFKLWLDCCSFGWRYVLHIFKNMRFSWILLAYAFLTKQRIMTFFVLYMFWLTFDLMNVSNLKTLINHWHFCSCI